MKRKNSLIILTLSIFFLVNHLSKQSKHHAHKNVAYPNIERNFR